MENSNPAKIAEDQKILLLHIVSKKVVEMTRELPGLDILDFNISKTSKRVTLSIGYKQEFKPQQKFDLSNIFVHDPVGPQHNIAKHQDFQPDQGLLNIHHKDSTYQDIQANQECNTRHQECKERCNYRVPMCDRREFSEEPKSPHEEDMPGLEIMQSEIVKLLTDLNKPEVYIDEEENTVPNWFSTFLNTNVDKMDEDYFNSLLKQREAHPGNPTTQRRIDSFMKDNFRKTEEDDISCYREFVPGQPWMSRAQKKREDLYTTMNEIEVSISVLRPVSYTHLTLPTILLV